MKSEEERQAECDATYAAMQLDSPLLARPLYLYRTNHKLTVEQMATWLGLDEPHDFYRLAVFPSPRPAIARMGWKDYTYSLNRAFPSLKLNRLQLVAEIIQPPRSVATIVSFRGI